MKIAIHEDANPPTSFGEKWAFRLAQSGVEVKWVNLRLPEALNQVRGCQGVMWHWEYMPHERQVAQSILRAIEQYLHIPVFPDYNTCWHYDDKIAQLYIFKALKLPIPKTWVFWDRAPAEAWARSAGYPKVFKLRTGSSSANVHLVNSADEALRIIDLMFGPGVYPRGFKQVRREIDLVRNGKTRLAALTARFRQALRLAVKAEFPERFWWQIEKNYVYFQDFIPGNSGDTRVTVIGNRAFALRRFNRPDDFRASGSKRFDFDTSQIPIECVRLAHRISAELRVQSMAYDFLMNQSGGPVLSEMSYIYSGAALERCPGYWTSDLLWIPRAMKPEAAHVEDFLARIRGPRPSRGDSGDTRAGEDVREPSLA